MRNAQRRRLATGDDVGVLEMRVKKVGAEVSNESAKSTRPVGDPTMPVIRASARPPRGCAESPDNGVRWSASCFDDGHLDASAIRNPCQVDQHVLGSTGSEVVDEMEHPEREAIVSHRENIGTSSETL